MDLTQTHTKRLGGYNRIQIVLIDDLIDFPSIINDVETINPSTIQTQNGWSTLKVTPGSIQVNPKPERTRAGKITPTEITASFPDDDAETLKTLKHFDQRQCLVRVRANNKKEKLYGTPDNPLRFFYAPNSNQTPSDPTGYQIQLTGSLISEPLFLENE